jgi:hypothetical protein
VKNGGYNCKMNIIIKPGARTFISQIARVIRSELISELENAKYVSLLLDGSTDKEGVEEEFYMFDSLRTAG